MWSNPKKYSFIADRDPITSISLRSSALISGNKTYVVKERWTCANQIYCVSLSQIFDITYEERWRDRPCETLATCRYKRKGAKSDQP